MACDCFGKPVSKTPFVKLNVGGRIFMTKRSVLERYPNTLLQEVLAQGPCHDGVYFLDRDSRHFDIILNFLRDGPELFLRPQDEQVRSEVAHEAEQLRLHVLANCLREEPSVHHVAPTPVRAVEFEGEYLGAPLANNEAERLAYLRSLNVVDTDEHESKYDAITKVVSALMDVPIVLVSLVEEHKQWFKSRCGLEANSTPRCTSFCAFALLPEDPSTAALLVIEDTYRDARVARNPLVLGQPFIRFYAGCPLVSPNGLRLGTLCVIDRSPRTCTPAEAQMICNFANLVVQEIERESLAQRPSILDSSVLDAATPAGFTSGPLRQMRMKASLSEVVLLVWASHKSMTWPVLYASEAWTELSGLHVVPPSHFGRRPKPSAVFRGSTRVEDLSLWNCIHLQTCSSEAIEALWQWVQEGTAPYAVEGTIPRTVAGKAKSVMCRLSPVSIPLDVNAASVKCGQSLTSNHFSHSPNPDGWRDGCLVYAVVSMKDNRCDERFVDVSAESVMNLKPTRSSFEDVSLLRIIGTGSFGKVYFSLWSGAPVAVKVMVIDSPDAEGTYVFEASLSTKLMHPNLVQTFNYSTMACEPMVGGGSESLCQNVHDGQSSMVHLWIVQEWCDGGTLRQYCDRPRCADVERVLDIMLEIAGAGVYLHNRGVIHGDLTGSNVLLKKQALRKGFVCKVGDFGLSQVLAGDSESVVTGRMGTVTHMPPELFDVNGGKAEMTTKADVYALGVLLWQCLTGEEPFEGFTPPQIVLEVAGGTRLQLPPTVPSSVAEFYSHLTEAQPCERPTFEEALADIATLLNETS